MRGFLLTTWVLAGLGATSSVAFEGKPKFGPEAVPITQQTEYLRTAPAPDYWKLSPFYVPQQTSSACSLASVVMALNALRGLPARSDQRLVTQSILLKKMSRAKWTKQVTEGGSGVTFDGLVALVRQSLARFQLRDDDVEVIRPADEQPETLARLRQILSDNEVSDRDVILVYFNQGMVTGDWDGPHVSPIGAYDAHAGQVLILDVDREWYVPYWTADTQLLKAMLRPAPARHGPLAGETGGLIWIKPRTRH
ncbi:MAG: phytochelatin synthase family protein [Candidatus Contendobacter sp.]|nr:phytochelatin synthase family protein [Candidatus Contendobacter sp.]